MTLDERFAKMVRVEEYADKDLRIELRPNYVIPKITADGRTIECPEKVEESKND